MFPINGLVIAREVVKLISSAGAGVVVQNGIMATTPRIIKPLNRVLVRIGSYAVSGVVASKAGEYAGEQFDELIDKTKELIEFVKSKRK